jgi:hydrogenase expression/formation protein HypE
MYGMSEQNPNFQLNCPVPLPGGDRIQMAHGGGGTLTNDLIERVFRKAFGTTDLSSRHDSAVLSSAGRIAFTTDSYVVKPLFFPGGDIGTLAVNGTVNDLAMSGAKPIALSAAFILEEGLPVETLQRVADSMRRAADEAGVSIVTGDTKVVDAGKGDQLFVTTAGVGRIEHSMGIGPGSVKPGDAILVSGDLGRHGVAILAVREGLAFETELVSDCAPLWPSVEALLAAGVEIHCLRDLTRGGLSSALNEIARDSGTDAWVEEARIPVPPSVHSACEILGLDPFYVANEGRFAVYVPENQAETALAALQKVPVSSGAVRIGWTGKTAGNRARVFLKTRLGSDRVMDMLSGEQLPRIC